MKNYLLLALFAASLVLGSCSKNSGDDTDTGGTTPVNTGNVVEVSGDISANTTWTADKIYLLKGFVYVTNGATLTIEPGTIIKGEKVSKSTLVVTRGSKIMAVGNADKPIVFTSNAAAGARREGDWGGVILLGKAPTNRGANIAIEGGLTPTNGGDAAKYIQYGGTETTDNSGKLKYVRIEFAGVPFSLDNEINGLTMGGVGSGTEIDYVEVYRSGDDAFEWFGGTVNAKHLLAIGSWDDDFDTDNGFSGKIQFALAQRFPLTADQSGSNGFESDNDADGSANAPKTSALFSNVTVVGPYAAAGTKVNGFFQHAAQIRRNSAISTSNSIFAGFPEGIYIDDDSKAKLEKPTTKNFLNGDLVFVNNLIYGCNAKSNEVKGTNKGEIEQKLRADNSFVSDSYANALLADPFKYPADVSTSTGVPSFLVKVGAGADTGAAFAGKFADAFFDKVGFKGAFGSENWANGWANFDPQTIAYSTPGAVK